MPAYPQPVGTVADPTQSGDFDRLVGQATVPAGKKRMIFIYINVKK